MATDPQYLYVPDYGVEPYQAQGTPENSQTGGGAEVTNDNLLISLWAFDPSLDAVPTTGLLLKPITAFGDFTAGTGAFGTNDSVVGLATQGMARQFNSRVASRFYVNNLAKGVIAGGNALLAVLNPPSELQAMLARAIESVVASGSPTGWTVTLIRSVIDTLTWNIEFRQNIGSGDVTAILDPLGALVTPVGGTSTRGSVVGEFPLLRTNGADGVFPQFYQSINTTGGGLGIPTVQQLLVLKTALDTGNFFVPIILQTLIGATDLDVGYTIEWPHSIARG